jgi:iron complex transport system ATP-binding protein
MLVARDLCVMAGGASLLERINLSIAPGRMTAVVGPNGAGKSTLLACLAGLRVPHLGAVALDGTSFARLAPAERARRIGYLPQEAPVHWNIPVRTLVALGRYPHRRGLAGESEADRLAVRRALEEVGLVRFAERPVATLSGGERARAHLARVLAGRPDWILLDEPLAALDLSHRFALMALLRTVAARGVGVVIVVHDLALAGRMADDALLLESGRLAASGPVLDVLTPACLGPVFGADFTYGAAADGTPTLIAAPRFP